MTQLNRGPSNSLKVESWLNESHSMIGVVIGDGFEGKSLGIADFRFLESCFIHNKVWAVVLPFSSILHTTSCLLSVQLPMNFLLLPWPAILSSRRGPIQNAQDSVLLHLSSVDYRIVVPMTRWFLGLNVNIYIYIYISHLNLWNFPF